MSTLEARLNALLEGDDPEVVSVRTTFMSDLTQTRSSLHDISTTVDRIEGIQSAIRNQTRVDSKPSAVQLRPLIDECLTILGSKLKPLCVDVVCPEELLLECRRSQLGQVITNLLSNAADALMEKGLEQDPDRREPHLLVRAASGENVVTIEIEDDVPGISQDKMDKIFTPFFTTKAVGVGTGLGLSICQNIFCNRRCCEFDQHKVLRRLNDTFNRYSAQCPRPVRCLQYDAKVQYGPCHTPRSRRAGLFWNQDIRPLSLA